MTALPDREHQALLLRQGHAWIRSLADLDGWTEAREDEAHHLLDACRPEDLARLVEHHRAVMWDTMQRRRAAPTFERTVNGQPIAPPAPPPRRPRGLARHLARKPIATSAQVDLFGKNHD